MGLGWPAALVAALVLSSLLAVGVATETRFSTGVASGGTLRAVSVQDVESLDPAFAGRGLSSELSGKYVVVRSGRAGQSWLELRTFPVPSARALTPRPVAGERRAECCSLFSPDGSKLAFQRTTHKTNRLLVLDLDTSTLRTTARLPANRSWAYVWASDSSALLYSNNHVNPVRVHRVPVDGVATSISAFRTAWGGTWPEGTSPDGSAALVVESRGPALYFEYKGPDVLYAVGDGMKVRLATTASVGDAAWSPDGSLVAYSANCFSLCRIEVVRPDGGGRRPLTHFRNRTSPYSGYDSVSFDWAGRGGELVYGRGRTLYGIDVASGNQRRIVTLPCPRRRCAAVSTSIFALSQERDKAFVEVSDWPEIEEAGAEGEASRLYRVSLLTGSFARADSLADASDIWFAQAASR